jgi:hypothetical protein
MSKKNRPTDSGGNWMDTYGNIAAYIFYHAVFHV